MRKLVQSIGPLQDKIITQNGDDVVVFNDSNEIRILSYEDSLWFIFGYQSVSAAAAENVQEAEYYYNGTGYIGDALITHACFDDSMPIYKWGEVYNKVSSRKIYEEEESLELFECLTKACSGGLCHLDKTGAVIYATDRFVHMMNMAHDEVLGVGWQSHIHDADRQNIERELSDFFFNHRPFLNVEFRLNDERWVSLHCMPHGSRSQDRVGYTLLAQDITHKQQYEQQLEKKITDRTQELESVNEMFKAIVNDQTDLICRYKEDRKLLFVNDAYCRYFGVKNKEILGTDFLELIPPEDHEKVLEHFIDFEVGQVRSHEHQVLTKGGTRWQKWINRAIRRNGQLEFQAVGRDVTERREIEDRLKQTHERLKYVIDSSPAVIYTCMPEPPYNTTFMSDNSREIMGYEPEEILQPNGWANLIHPEDQQKIFDGLECLFAVNYHTHEYRIKTKDGRYVWIRDDLHLIRDSSDNPVEIVGCCVNITADKEEEATLARIKDKMEHAEFFEQAPDIMLSVDAQTGKIVVCNQAMCTKTGYSKEEIIGMPIADLYTKESQPQVREYLEQFRTSGELINVHLIVQCKDGSEMPICLNVSSIRDEHGNVIRSRSVLREVVTCGNI